MTDDGGAPSAGDTYAEFRVRIERGPSKRTYRVYATGPAGQVEGLFRLPFSDLELENFILKVRGTRSGVRSVASTEAELAKEFGSDLFDALFDNEVRGLYRASTVEATNARQGLRISIALTSVPELLRVPWEYLYDRPVFPSTDRRTPIVRYLDLPKPIKPFRIQLPLRILAIVSAPLDAEPIDAEKEAAKLDQALEPLKQKGAVVCDWLPEASLSALFRRLSEKDHVGYHILHFIGHGGFVKGAKEGVLLFEDEKRARREETGDRLGAILRMEESLRLAVLNSCEGARGSINDPFSGVASSLIEHEIPAVIGMQFEITDRAAILFSSEFYRALADGRAVDESLSQARMAIFADNNDIEWGTPVLFTRVTDGRLFDVGPVGGQRADATAEVEPAEAARRRLAAAVAAEEPAARAVDVAAAVGLGIVAAAAGSATIDAGAVEVAGGEAQPLGAEAAEADRQREQAATEAAAAAEVERERRQVEAEAAEAERERLQAEAEAADAERERLAAEAAAAERQRLADEAAEAEEERLAAEAVAAEAERERQAAAAATAERERLAAETAAADAERERAAAEAAEAERQRLAAAKVAAAAAAQKRLEADAAERDRQAAVQAAAKEQEAKRLQMVAAAETARRQREAQAAEESERARRESATAEAAEADRRRADEDAQAERERAAAETEAAAKAAEVKRRASQRRRRILVGAVVGAAAVTLAAVLLLFVLPRAGPSIDVALTPGTDPPAASVTGKGFDPGEAVVLRIGSTVLTTVTAATDGTFETSIAIPAGAASPSSVEAVGQTSQRSADGSIAFGAGASAAARGSSVAIVGPSASQAAPTAKPAQTQSVIPTAQPPIVFYSDAQPGSVQKDNEIYTVDPVTKRVSRLTTNTVEDTFATWSADGSQIAFARGNSGARDIYTMDALGKSQKPLVTGGTDDWFPAWSKIGAIAFVRGTSDIAVYHDGTVETLVDGPDDREVQSPAWAPNGLDLAFFGDLDERGNDDVYVVHQDGSLDRLIDSDVVDRNPTWSPDGRTIAFVRDRGESGPADRDIYLFDVATRQVTRRLTDNDVQDGNPVWSRDGKTIAFYRAFGNGFHIMTIAVDGTGETDLMESRAGKNLDPNWR